MEEELRDYLEKAAEELIRRGMTPEKAWRAVRAEMGSIEAVKEQARSAGWEDLVESFWQDIRFACRQLYSNFGFTLTTLISLGLGIGATVSVFSVIYAVLLHPYPFPNVDRLAYLDFRDKTGKLDSPSFSVSQLLALQRAHSIESIAGYNEWPLTITGRDVPEVVKAYLFTGDSFKTFGISPRLGRSFGSGDDPVGKQPRPVIVLNYRFWRKRFNGNPAVLGHTLELNHVPYTMIGVTDPRFTWGDDVDVYLPQKLTNDPEAGSLSVIVKLRPGITRVAANAELQSLLKHFAGNAPGNYLGPFKVNLQPLNAGAVHDLGGTLSLLFAAVMLLLAIGCGNVSILLLARGTARQHELAIRSALGASNSRIIRQLLTESLILAITGAGAGILVAYEALHFIVAWWPQHSYLQGSGTLIHFPVLLFSVGLAFLSGILFGLFPALQLVKPEMNEAIKSGTRKIVGGVRGKRMHNSLVAGQIALTLLLLTTAGTAIEGFLHLMHIPLGFDPHNVLSLSIPPAHDGPLADWQKQANYFEQLREKIAQMPEVLSAGITTMGMPPYSGWDQLMEVKGSPSSDKNYAALSFVSSEFFSALRIPLLAGRLWDRAEGMRGATLAVVNQAFAKRYFPNGDLLGTSVRLPHFRSEPPYMVAAPGSDGWLQIVGIVADARNDGLGKPVKPAIYVPYSLALWKGTQIVLRTRTEPLSVLRDIQKQLASVNSDQAVVTAWTNSLENIIQQEPESARGRLISTLFGAFAILALAMAAIGLYSVVSYSVAQRTGEFGVRLALGAQKHDVFQIVLASAATNVGLGLAIGLVLSFGLNRFVTRWVENGTRNPQMIVIASLAILLTALLACLIPARRTLSIDPMTSLRCE